MTTVLKLCPPAAWRASFLLFGQIGEGDELAQLLGPAAPDAGEPLAAALAEAFQVAVLEGDVRAAVRRGREGQLDFGDEVRVEALLAVQLPTKDQPRRDDGRLARLSRR